MKFVILDAGMNDLIRPALYQAVHAIDNLTSDKKPLKYDVVGPVCESSDKFAHAILLPETQRGDLFAIHTAGAYGQVMAMKYNQRDLAKAYYSDEILKK
jgi:diaminopimelate decarboxylase